MSGFGSAGIAGTIALALAGVTAACGDRHADPQQQAYRPECGPAAAAEPPLESGSVADSYAPERNVSLPRRTRTETGMYVQDLEAGTGVEAEIDDRVVVHYTGWLPNGQQFDSSYDRGEPLEFALNRTSVIPGWVYGVSGMKEGGKRKLVIPPGLGYGDRGAGGVIPPGATLVFDVELIEVHKPAPNPACEAG
jgi:FKBP-type peptidyl-prolyl cis-trans isomerase